MAEHCARCGRFVGEEALEGVNWSAGMQQDGDVAWTGRFYCAFGVGCNSVEEAAGRDPLSGLVLEVADVRRIEAG